MEQKLLKAFEKWSLAFGATFTACYLAWGLTRIIDKFGAYFDPFLGHDENRLTPWTADEAAVLAAEIAAIVATVRLVAGFCGYRSRDTRPSTDRPLQSLAVAHTEPWWRRNLWALTTAAALIVLAAGSKAEKIISGGSSRIALFSACFLIIGALFGAAFRVKQRQHKV
jgi:hypothetical protein